MLEKFVRRRPRLLRWAYRAKRWLRPLREHPLAAIPAYIGLFLDWRRYLAAGGRAKLADFHPCLFDRVAATPTDPHYFYQAAWAFRRISIQAPPRHVDIGSDARFVGMLSQAIPLTFVDIRPLQVELPGLDCRIGSVLDLPYAEGSLQSMSCLHVIEHIGLGRYGDPLDPQGSLKAARELSRVLAPGGRLYLSAPVGRERVCFNGHRIFSASKLLETFGDLALVEFSLVDDEGRLNLDASLDSADSGDYGCGLFIFEKIVNPAGGKGGSA
ncbi:MAG: DUF268 domain-containing protein [Sterolibacterium sp.]